MSPLTGLVQFGLWFYKDVAPTVLGQGGPQAERYNQKISTKPN
jgi:hypothetical protein